MRHVPVLLLGGVVTVIAIASLAACGSSNSQPAQPTSTAYPPGQYPPGTYPPGQQPPGYPTTQPGYPPGGYTTQPGYPPPGATATPPGYPPQPGAAPGGQLATPGPLALPCQNDMACGTHKCNTQYSKCAFPCASDFDCIQGAACMAGLQVCTPKAPGQ